MALLDLFRNRIRKPPGAPMQARGVPSIPTFGGYVAEPESDPGLVGTEKYRQFNKALINCAIAAAGVRYFLNLCAKSTWTFEPAETDDGEEMAERAKEILQVDPLTSWERIIRRAAMYRFFGFAIQEWTAARREDGVITLLDVAPRAQTTIEKWDVSREGYVLGVTQRNPQDGQEIYLPRGKIVYVVDDAIYDSPQGLGLFMHIFELTRRLRRFEQLEGFGLETDLRGVPLGKAPYSELNRLVAADEITEQQAKDAIKPLEDFIKKHIKNPELGLLLDSEPFSATDEAQRPTTVPKFDLQLLSAASSAHSDVAAAIERVNREIARVLGVEAILLGDGQYGSFALAKDKTNQFSLVVDATLQELADAFRNDLLIPIWKLNGWDKKSMPKIIPQETQQKDIDSVTDALRNMAQAGAPMALNDPAINYVRAKLDIPPLDSDTAEYAEGVIIPENRRDDLARSPSDRNPRDKR